MRADMDQLLALRVFLRIAETGGFSKAADLMNIPRPTVTKLVQDLERHLGTKLLRRTTRKVQVTAEGAAYYERALRVVAEVEEMDQLVKGSRVQLRGRLRVDVGSVLAHRILLPALPRFRALYPALRLELGVSDRPIDLVGDGVDCAIRGGELPDTSMVARRLASLGWVTCASAEYLRLRGEPKHPDELCGDGDGEGSAGHELASYFSSLTGRAFALEFHRGSQTILVKPEGGVLCNESTAHVHALVCGLGVGQTFRVAAAPHLADGSLREVLPDWTRPAQTFSLVYPGGRELNARVRAFSDWVAELFASLDEGKV